MHNCRLHSAGIHILVSYYDIPCDKLPREQNIQVCSVADKNGLLLGSYVEDASQYIFKGTRNYRKRVLVSGLCRAVLWLL